MALNSSIWVEDTTFEHNSADVGAVVYGQESNITTYNSNFVYNNAFSQGALTAYKCLVDVAVCMFIGNRATDDGSVIFTSESSFYIADSFFSTNSADYNGGVISSTGGSFHIVDSTFSDNAAPIGGVIYIKEGSFHIADSSFSNTYHGGVIIADTSLFTVSNNSFTNNSADNGGVIFLFGSSFRVTDSTFKKIQLHWVVQFIQLEARSTLSTAHLETTELLLRVGSLLLHLEAHSMSPTAFLVTI